ncbi:MAG: hypothetical protein L0Z70_16445 [Chloroflexi bacterium]|nr:hypothetical protein [Chloroflexota bacterium]
MTENGTDGLWARVARRIFAREIEKQARLAARALDDASDRLASQNTAPRDRRGYDRQAVLADALEAWRQNPLARRIVELTTQYVVGGGLSLECDHPASQRFLDAWQRHRLNRMEQRVFDLCDELTRSGNLFLLLSTDAAGMTYVRALPAQNVLDIECAPTDVEQETVIWEAPRLEGGEALAPNGMLGAPWQVYDPARDAPRADGSFPTVALHYAVNRPVGALWGESDLAPVLRWLARYAAWLEDRARLNRYRQSFLYVVKARFTSQAERLARQAEINANPPNPGSILVTDESESWETLAPQLASFEAAEDGLALKKMIAAGSGNPLHFLAEPESATRTTAEAAGGPTFRHYEQRQQRFLWMMADLAQAALQRRALVDRSVSARAKVTVRGADITARDNQTLAAAAAAAVAAFGGLRDRGLIDDAELLRLAYRFAGEVADAQDLLRRARGQAKETA